MFGLVLGFPSLRHTPRKGRRDLKWELWRPITSMPTRQRLLQNMRHQELQVWRAVGTHYGPTRIYGPTSHTIGGTAQQALRELLPQAGLCTTSLSDDYGPAAIRRSKDLAAAARARATRMSRLRAGDAAGGRGPERRCTTGPTTTRPPGAGRRVSPERGTRRAVQVNLTRHVFGLFLLDPETVRYLDHDTDRAHQASFAGPSDATPAMAAMLLRHAIAARTGQTPAALSARQTLHEIWLDSDPQRRVGRHRGPQPCPAGPVAGPGGV
jgi:hypothetical protein